MTVTRHIATAFLLALLLAPLAAPLCAVGVCGPDVACELPMRPAGPGDGGPELRGPDCCLDVPVAAAERSAATSAATQTPAVPVLHAVSLAASPQSPLVALPATPARGGRATLTLHRTLLL